MAIILRRGSATVPAAANMDLWNGNADTIVEWLMVDPEKASEVWRALGERLASSMSIVFFTGHGIENPR
jgi:hypothetical protein